ncbi:DMT family transporter [Pseudomonas sp. NPDC098740]|uniref:DMT family transporter n=1 Tax=Pseudomonas sp. NPDC098740 TaxID=3364486 RepID=UPI00383BF66A
MSRPGNSRSFLPRNFARRSDRCGASRTLPVGTAYAVWTGIGTAGTATYKPSPNALRYSGLSDIELCPVPGITFSNATPLAKCV